MPTCMWGDPPQPQPGQGAAGAGVWWGQNWGFPKGKCEGKESPETCAARETFEEVGIDVVQMIDSQEWFERQIGTKVGKIITIAVC